MRLVAILAAGLALCWGNGAQAQTGEEPSPRARELAARYVELADLRGMMLAQMEGMTGLQDEMMTGFEALGMPVKGDAAGEMPTFVPDGSLDGMEPMIVFIEDILVQAIAETYPEPELVALVGFYETEVGRSILRRQATLETRMTGLMYERMPEMLAAMGIDPSAAAAMYGSNGEDFLESATPSRQMDRSSPNARGMSLDDMMLYGSDAPVLVVTEGWPLD